jgi:hypothetical protein
MFKVYENKFPKKRFFSLNLTSKFLKITFELLPISSYTLIIAKINRK